MLPKSHNLTVGSHGNDNGGHYDDDFDSDYDDSRTYVK